MRRRTRNRLLPLGAAVLAAAAVNLGAAQGAAAGSAATNPVLGHYRHLVVIYEENHSFDNLYGGWGSANGRPVDGLTDADPTNTLQVKQDGRTYACLLQNDVNLATPPLSARCTDDASGTTFASHFPNRPFAIDDYVEPTDATCPLPGGFSSVLKGTGLPGGCTRDLVHRFYQEQYQLDGGRQDRYTTGSDAVGLTQGYYRTQNLPIYRYLHSPGAPKYVIADRFFQGAFGGSFLNHQYLVAAAAPPFPGAVNDGSGTDLHSVLDANGFPKAYPLHAPTTATVKDSPLTQACGLPTTKTGVACGDFAVNTIQPQYQPYTPGTPDASRLPAVDDRTTAKNIGDLMSIKRVSWAWYSGGWDNAAGNVGGPGWTNGTAGTCADPRTVTGATYPNCPDTSFQYHHQPLNYFARYAPGTPDRAAHLKDEKAFLAAARRGALPQVSFVKPIGAENEHPGYASESNGSRHLVTLLKAIAAGPQAKDTLVVVTYDEFGGQWDHVSPPGQTAGGRTNGGPHDLYGPGTRVPALVISPSLPHSGVDFTSHDTTSILATISRAYGLPALTPRCAAVSDLRSALRAAGVRP
ncbi:MAG: acid phosphatase [Frankiaceae bacterium]